MRAAVIALALIVSALIVAPFIVPTCETEDSSNCVWIADIQGNGLGKSFLDINGTAYYVPFE